MIATILTLAPFAAASALVAVVYLSRGRKPEPLAPCGLPESKCEHAPGGVNHPVIGSGSHG